MGNIPSKTPSKEDNNISSECNTTLENVTMQCSGDPRSPTIDINRTPLQTIGASKTNLITKNVDLSKECFEKHEKDALNTPRIKALMNNIDPRSPAMDFQRTPLIFLTKNQNSLISSDRINNKELLNKTDGSDQKLNDSSSVSVTCIKPKNLCVDLNNISIEASNEMVEHQDEPINQVKEDNIPDSSVNQLEVSISKNQIGLLETNLDFIETDLDTVRRRYSNRPKVNNLPSKVLDDEINSDVSPPSVNKDLSDKDPRSPNVDIARTPILFVENTESTEPPKPSFSDNNKLNSHMQDLFKYNLKLQKKKGLYEKDLNKKLTETLLIYEDNFDELKPAAVTPKTNSNMQNDEGSRTPLSCKVNTDKGYSNSKPSTPLSTLYTDISSVKSSTLTKLEKRKSRIPIKISKISPHSTLEKTSTLETRNPLKCHVISSGTENTPPQPRKACWDKDNSVIL